jgi:hypothetical protein
MILLALWVAAAVVLWRHANEDDASGWLRFVALVVIAPLFMFAMGLMISKHMAKRRR